MKKAVMYGAGNIGRGFVGQLFYESGYAVTFIDVDAELVGLLNSRGRYPVRILEDAGAIAEVWVENAAAVNGRDIKAAAAAIAEAEIMATAVGGPALAHIAPAVAAGLALRDGAGGGALNIIICENLHNGDKIFKELVAGLLPEGRREAILEKTGFVPASVGRMVPAVTEELKAFDPLCVGAESYCTLPVDKEAFKGKLPGIKNLLPAGNFGYYTDAKLYVHNMLHSSCAYFGAQKGYRYIYEAMGDGEIYSSLRAALEAVSGALEARHGVGREETLGYGRELFRRFKNRALGDEVLRVGRDTPRKLARDDRLIGAALLCEEYGADYKNIAKAAAAALAFDLDPASAELCAYAAEKGALAALLKYSGLAPDSPLAAAIAAEM